MDQMTKGILKGASDAPSTPEEWEAHVRKLVHLRWDKDRMQVEWDLWEKDLRDLYVFWREELMDCGITDRLLIANAASQQVLVRRVQKGCGKNWFSDDDVKRLCEFANGALPLRGAGGRSTAQIVADHAVQQNLFSDKPQPAEKGKGKGKAAEAANAAGGEAPKRRKTTRSVTP